MRLHLRAAGLALKPARLFLIFVYVVLMICLTDWLLFSRGLLWKIPPPRHGVTGLPPAFSDRVRDSDFFSVMNINSDILRINSSRKKSGDRIKILFLGDSTVGAGVDHQWIKSLLYERFKGKSIRCYNLNCGGLRCYETPFITDQIAKNGIDILVYGVFFGDFTHVPDYPSAPVHAGIYWNKPLSVENARLDKMNDYADEMLRRHWSLYRYKGWLKEFSYCRLGAYYYQFFPPVSIAAASNSSPDPHWQKWLETGDISAYRDYLSGIRAKVYMDFFLDSSIYDQASAKIETNLKYLEQMIAICKSKNIHLVTMHMPVNPILGDFGIHTPREFVDSRLAPFWKKNNVTFYDFSEHLSRDCFLDFNHLNAEGRKQFSLMLADTVTDEISKNGFARLSDGNAGKQLSSLNEKD
ncbi:hypothetical protein HZA56_08100 [Candidatus Poribacteria bacterium]|nr:hypothetical protein [Candidatus Poribacteria bacterium]